MRSGVLIEEVALEEGMHSRTYRGRLLTCLTVFLKWVASVHAHEKWFEDEVLANQLLCNFVQSLCSNNEALWKARHTVLAVQTSFRHLKGRLGRAWNAVKAWQMRVPVHSRIPLTPDILRAMFALALTFGVSNSKDAHLWFSFAVCLRLGFAALLRPSELTKLRVGDLRLPRSQWEPFTLVVTLLDPKNKASLGRYQFVMVDDPGLVKWVMWLTAGWPGCVKLWPSSHGKFIKFFKHCVARLGLERLGLTVGSLRPGGATAHFLEHRCIPSLRILGRWRVESSLEHYIQTVVAHMTYTDLTDSEHEHVTALGTATQVQWSEPPAQPWHQVFGRHKQWQATVARTKMLINLRSTTWQGTSLVSARSILAA